MLRILRAAHPPRCPVQKVTLPWGLEIQINVNEDIGRSIWHMGIYDLAVSEVLWRLLEDGDVAVDAGANIGHMTSIMALQVGRQGRVLAFEPHPILYKELQYNVRLFQQRSEVGSIETFEIALSSRGGEDILVCGDDFKTNRGTARLVSNASTGISVTVRPLDGLMENCNVAILKLDVEDHELQVLKGAEQLLCTGRIQNIVYESHEGLVSPVHQFLAQFGYSVYALGWKMGGPVLSHQSSPVAKAYEPQSYLATLSPDKALSRLARRGWAVLQREHNMRFWATVDSVRSKRGYHRHD
jgi:FkbM family methyltransferase